MSDAILGLELLVDALGAVGAIAVMWPVIRDFPRRHLLHRLSQGRSLGPLDTLVEPLRVSAERTMEAFRPHDGRCYYGGLMTIAASYMLHAVTMVLHATLDGPGAIAH